MKTQKGDRKYTSTTLQCVLGQIFQDPSLLKSKSEKITAQINRYSVNPKGNTSA